MKKLIGLLRSKIYIVLFICLVLLFFYPFVFFGKIPIPADTIVGMYHPFRDVIWDKFTQGVPFKNFLITDPVRQQYVWRNLAIEQLKKGQLPLWNPYSFSGTPLFANFQSAVFYPLNILFIILPFNLAWGVLILLQPLLSGIFLYLYLKCIKVSDLGSFLGALAFSFSGFSIAWMEWNTIGHTALWLPLVLLSIEKIFENINRHSERISSALSSNRQRLRSRNKQLIIWLIIFTLSLTSSFFAGHLQIFFYSFLTTTSYLVVKIIVLNRNRFKLIILFVFCFLLFAFIASPVWLSTLKFISFSARDIDQGNFVKQGWFIPWQNLLQFVAPDFFGNPATGNYFGVWNYAEFVGYIGVVPLILALYALIYCIRKKTLFFGALVFLSLLFALPTWLAQLPFKLQLPLISSSQPTRLIFITDFSLCILASLGFDHFSRNKNWRQIFSILLSISLILSILWLVTGMPTIFKISILLENLAVVRRNLIFPTLLLIFGSALIFLLVFTKKKFLKSVFIYCLILFIAFDLFRFGWKFTPFSSPQWIFPSTKIIEVIAGENRHSRFMSMDRRIMPANFSVYYKIQDVSGYDPLYLYLYNQLASSWDKNKADLTPASFNRIVTPMNVDSIITDLLGVEYIMSFGPSKYPWLELIIIEGQTYLYRNKNAFPRAFFADEVLSVADKQEELEKMFSLKEKLRNTAVTSERINIKPSIHSINNTVSITDYTDNMVVLQSNSEDEKLLILTDIYYPNWQVLIDGKKAKIIRVDFALRGVVIPKGEHKIEFRINII